MRVGTNPNTTAKVRGYGKIVLSVITHLPVAGGYHKDRLKVVKCCLETMRRNAGVDCQVLVWDNGSYPSFTNWLKYEYEPDYLILSPNVGKSIARASIVRMLPPETIVGVSDDDMFFYPNWLKAHMELLEHFPNVGTVSGWPVRTQFKFHNTYTLKWAAKEKSLEFGRFISEQEDHDFCRSIGRDIAWHDDFAKDVKDARIYWRGVKAYATGHHCQWIGYAGRIAPLLEYTQLAMPDERPFEQAVDRANLLRLTTIKRTTLHIGNVLDKELEDLWLHV